MVSLRDKEIFWEKTKISNREFKLTSGGTVIALLKQKKLKQNIQNVCLNKNCLWGSPDTPKCL